MSLVAKVGVVARTIAIWFAGLLASGIFGGMIGKQLDIYGEGQFYGMIGGMLTFTCVRLWLAEGSRISN